MLTRLEQGFGGILTLGQTHYVQPLVSARSMPTELSLRARGAIRGQPSHRKHYGLTAAYLRCFPRSFVLSEKGFPNVSSHRPVTLALSLGLDSPTGSFNVAKFRVAETTPSGRTGRH